MIAKQLSYEHKNHFFVLHITAQFTYSKQQIVNFIAYRSQKIFISTWKATIYLLIYFLQTASSFTNTAPHNLPASFMISITPRDAFDGFTFAAFSAKPIPVASPVMITSSATRDHCIEDHWMVFVYWNYHRQVNFDGCIYCEIWSQTF